jgi:hypothetical protein
MSVDFVAARAANPIERFLEDHGVKLRASGNRLIGKCPIHQERNGEAFVVWPNSGKWLCSGKCAGEWPKGGDIEDLMVAMSGISRDEARARLRGNIGEVAPIIRTKKAEPKPGPTTDNPLFLPYIFSAEEKQFMRECSERFVERIDSGAWKKPYYRGWLPETVRGIALEGYIGRSENGESLQMTEAGCRIKWRRPEGNSYKFLFGKSWIWRGGLIPNHQIIYITEGEPDAITLINSGIEEANKEVAVVALQGASFKLDPWAFLFKGKQVIISTDYDKAGEIAARNIASALKSSAQQISILDLRKKAA